MASKAALKQVLPVLTLGNLIAQIEKVNSRPGPRFDDVLHSHNDVELRLSDLKALVP